MFELLAHSCLTCFLSLLFLFLASPCRCSYTSPSFLCLLLIFLYLYIFLCLCLKPGVALGGFAYPAVTSGAKVFAELVFWGTGHRTGYQRIQRNVSLSCWLSDLAPCPPSHCFGLPQTLVCGFSWTVIPHIFKDSSTGFAIVKANSRQTFLICCMTLESLSLTTDVAPNSPGFLGNFLATQASQHEKCIQVCLLGDIPYSDPVLLPCCLSAIQTC